MAFRAEYPGVEIPLIPDEPDNSTPVMWWKGLGEVAGDGIVESVGLFGGFLCDDGSTAPRV
jgi:hypothetical protein